MATPELKPSFLESFSPWSLSRSTTPKPGGDTAKKKEHESLQQGGDHTISGRGRPRLSLRRYPRDCPELYPRWFYAVDAPKRKPFLLAQTQTSTAEEKPQPAPKKFVAFSARDSQSIETAFQDLADDRDQVQVPDAEGDLGEARPKQTKDGQGRTANVAVNEDYLFDVDVEERELSPAYWLGPIYEVRRGTWFYAEGSTLRPCDENLATQLEEGYLKVRPWKISSHLPQRSASQPRPRPTSLRLPKETKISPEDPSSTPATPKVKAADEEASVNEPFPGTNPTYRLFGTYMNSIATYHDATTVWLSSDDFMSRLSSTVYQGLGSVGGVKIVRGYSEIGKLKESVETIASTGQASRAGRRDANRGPLRPQDQSFSMKRKSAPPGSFSAAPTDHDTEDPESEEPTRRDSEAPLAKLERQMSSLDTRGPEQLEEESRKQDEKEMEEFYRETEGDEQGREIEHLVLVTHGIGQRLGLRIDAINFVHDVNVLRKTLKAVYASEPDLQALNGQIDSLPKNCRIQVLPVCWRHLLDFPMQSLKQNRKELDLTDAGDYEEEYPSLQDITVDGVPAVRNLITDLAMDVLLYQSAYREHIAGIVQRECNRIYNLFKERHPSFKGRVSLIGHSLGSAVLFDILCRQKERKREDYRPLRHYSRGSKGSVSQDDPTAELGLDFDCESFFCLGSPIALFQMLKGRTIAARNSDDAQPAESPFDIDSMDDPFLGAASAGSTRDRPRHLIPVTVSSPKCRELYNIFHPTDPISYRVEPLISPVMASMKPQPLPYTKKGLFGAQGIGARMGQSVGTFWSSLTSGVASSLLNRSLGITGDEQALQTQTKGQLQNQSVKARVPGSQGKALGEDATTSTPTAVSEEKKRQIADDTLKADRTGRDLPTLIDSEMETLYSGFEKRRKSHQSDESRDFGEGRGWQEAEERARKLKREEGKVRALNSNGRVDYSIQEGVFDISLIASIASHLSYWADEDVNHFLISQLLSKGRPKTG